MTKCMFTGHCKKHKPRAQDEFDALLAGHRWPDCRMAFLVYHVFLISQGSTTKEHWKRSPGPRVA